MSHVFISYSKKDRQFARALADKLLDTGFDVWIDDRIDYGENWERVIFKAIEDCAAFIIIMSPNSYESLWVQREYHYAEKRGKMPFPVLLEGEEFPRYALTQYVDARDRQMPPADFYNRLANYVPRHLERGEEVVTVPETQAKRREDITETSEMMAAQVRTEEAQAAPVVIPPQPERTPATTPTPTDQPRPPMTETRFMGLPMTVFGVVLIALVIIAIPVLIILSRPGDNGGSPDDDSETITQTLDPNMNAERYFNRGVEALENGDYASAIADFSSALELNSEYASAYYKRGIAYQEIGEFENAYEDYSQAIDLDEEAGVQNLDLFVRRGDISFDHFYEDQHDEARDDYTRAINIDRFQVPPHVYVKRAWINYEHDEFDEAWADLDFFMEHYSDEMGDVPDLPEVYRFLGDYYYHKEDYEQALNYYNRYVERIEQDDGTVEDEIMERISELEATATPAYD